MSEFQDIEKTAGNSKVRIVDDSARILIAENERGRQFGNGSPRNDRSRSRSLSISRQRDPEIVLPALFRTVSYGVDDKIQERESKRIEKSSLFSSKATQNTIENFLKTEWHVLSPQQVCKELGVDYDHGLSPLQVQENMKRFGTNAHSPPPNRLFYKIFMYCFGGFGALLMAGGILCCIAWKPLGNPTPASANLALGVILFLVFFIQAGFNAWQDYSSSRVMASISSMVPEVTIVLREGQKQEIQTSQLVPGDRVTIKAGNKVPADMRIVEASNDLKFDQSILNGESKPVEGLTTSESAGSNYLEAKCIALQGSYCVTGTGHCVVVSTGDNTVFGSIAKMSSAPKPGLTPIQWEIMRFIVIVISIVVTLIIIVIVVWAAWIRRAYPGWITVEALIVNCVSVAVAFIPEGLPISLTTCLTITANAMKKQNVLCKSLSVVETLGSVSVICTDKTGTLTKNKMMVTKFSVGSKPFVTDAIHSEEENIERPTQTSLDQLHAVAALCNAADFAENQKVDKQGERVIIGDATDQAALLFAEQISPVKETRLKWNVIYDLAFNSKNKFMIRLMENNQTPEDLTMFVKGAPDLLLSKCGFFIDENNNSHVLDREKIAEIVDLQRKWSMEGKRVILLTRKMVSRDLLNLTNTQSTAFAISIMDLLNVSDMVLVGLLGISDPLKDEIPEVISTLHSASIRVFMVTGDYELTAVSIARQCGLVTSRAEDVDCIDDLDTAYPIKAIQGRIPDLHIIDRSIVISGPEMVNMNENQWEHLVKYKEIVFARTTPEQKLRIVKELQLRKHVVGMTGDGINDAPSLKAADVGIAMGNGSDVAIEASDLVLLDSFASIVQALKYGRLVFDNLKKTIIYLIPAGTYSELFPVLLSIFIGLPQAISSFLMIIICCLTDCAGAVTMAFESPERDLLTRKPRSVSGERLVNIKLILHAYFILGTIECLCSMSMAFWYLQRNGIKFSYLALKFGRVPKFIDPEFLQSVENRASSIYFVTLVIMQFFNLMATRTRYLSVFQHPPIFNKNTSNKLQIVAILFALGVIFFFNYIPWFQQILLTATIPVEYFFLPVAFGAFLLCFDELRKLIVRTYPKSIIGRLAW